MFCEQTYYTYKTNNQLVKLDWEGSIKRSVNTLTNYLCSDTTSPGSNEEFLFKFSVRKHQLESDETSRDRKPYRRLSVHPKNIVRVESG